MKIRCDNCEWEGTEADFWEGEGEQPPNKGRYLSFCPDLTERLDPGSEVPYGDCPECQCFCYQQKAPAQPQASSLKTISDLMVALVPDHEPIDHLAIALPDGYYDIRIESNNSYVCLIPNRKLEG